MGGGPRRVGSFPARRASVSARSEVGRRVSTASRTLCSGRSNRTRCRKESSVGGRHGDNQAGDRRLGEAHRRPRSAAHCATDTTAGTEHSTKLSSLQQHRRPLLLGQVHRAEQHRLADHLGGLEARPLAPLLDPESRPDPTGPPCMAGARRYPTTCIRIQSSEFAQPYCRPTARHRVGSHAARSTNGRHSNGSTRCLWRGSTRSTPSAARSRRPAARLQRPMTGACVDERRQRAR